MINAFDFEGSATLLIQARRVGHKVVRLKARAKAANHVSKNRIIAAEASTPPGSVNEPEALPPDHA